ncbi:MAG: serine/threonine-protein kinase [Planctomycetota bacterium]
MSEDQTTAADMPDPVSESIGPYRLLSRLGEGGFGVVYEAEQSEPVRRRVALKLVKPGMSSKGVLARFDAERQALAVMDHPGIARVFDGGVTDDGLPYFAMELVRGEPITWFCDSAKLSLRRRIELMIGVCEAVQHAHAKGVIHRDLKPANILVLYDQDQGIRSKVIDFGIAKALNQRLTDQTLFTERGQLIGTPEYMSPEQASLSGVDIDARSDIYSLGIVLYELLAGSTPFERSEMQSGDLAQFQQFVRETEPQKPSTRVMVQRADPLGERAAKERGTEPGRLARALRGDLDWIIMRCLEKDRERRYATSSELALDLRRYLEHEPVLAGPPSVGYRISKFATRYKGAVRAGALVAAVLLGMALWMVKLNFDLSGALREATDARRSSELALERAEAAESDALDAATELNAAVEFQEQQLASIDLPRMGAGIRGSIVRRAPEEAAALSGVNFADVARESLNDQVFTRTLDAIDSTFAGRPELRARMLQGTAATMSVLGLDSEAAGPQAEALAVRRQLLGDEHPDTLQSLYMASLIARDNGELDDAERLVNELRETSERVQGEDSDQAISAVALLATVREFQGDFESALELYEIAYERSVAKYGEDDEITLGILQNHSGSLRRTGNVDQAAPMLERVYRGHIVRYGAADQRTLGGANGLAGAYMELRRFDEAESLWREALDTASRELGDDDAMTLVIRGNLGSLYRRLGRFEEAEVLFREVFEGRVRNLGADHPDTLSAQNSLGIQLVQNGKHDEAQRVLERTVAAHRRVLGDAHPSTLLAIANLGSAYSELEKLDLSREALEEAVEGGKQALGPDHPSTIGWTNNLAALYSALGREDLALAQYRELRERSIARLGAQHMTSIILTNNVGSSLRRMGEYEEASTVGAEAVSLARQALPDSHWMIGFFMMREAQSRLGLGELERAEALLLESYERMQPVLGDANERVVEAVGSLVELYEAWEAREPGARGEALERWRNAIANANN